MADSSSSAKEKFKAGATEKGYSKRLAQAVLMVENSIRNKKDEELYVINEKGEIVDKIQGKDAGVEAGNYDQSKFENMILTHNHPRSIGETGLMRIGNSFSLADIMTAVRNNAREIRAVTPTYTFSLKRPKGGWGVSASQLSYEFKSEENNVRDRFYSHGNKHNYTNAEYQRMSVSHYHTIVRNLANKYGWNYTKKRG